MGNRNFWYAGWLLQRQVIQQLALGGEIFQQTSSASDHSGAAGFNLGGVYALTDHYYFLFSAGHGGLLYAVDAAGITKPFTY